MMDLIAHLKKQPWVVRWLKQLDRPIETVVDLTIDADTRLLMDGEPGYKPHWRTYTYTGLYGVCMRFTDGGAVFKTFTTQDFRIARRLAEKAEKMKT